jgi:hypothetical protein
VPCLDEAGHAVGGEGDAKFAWSGFVWDGNFHGGIIEIRTPLRQCPLPLQPLDHALDSAPFDAGAGTVAVSDGSSSGVTTVGDAGSPYAAADASMTVPVDVGIPFKHAKQNVISEFERRYISRLLAQRRSVLLQPYLERVDEQGEAALERRLRRGGAGVGERHRAEARDLACCVVRVLLLTVSVRRWRRHAQQQRSDDSGRPAVHRSSWTVASRPAPAR